MELLCVDIGSGTQDILILDTEKSVENAIQLVLPSPTVLAARKIEAASSARQSILFTGETMGGGACTWALREHLAAGLPAWATPDAARTFNDDLEEVAAWGVRIIPPDEVQNLRPDARIETKDVSVDTLASMLAAWDIRLRPDVVAVAVLDHGAAPPGESDRIFRFQNLARQLSSNRSLEGFMMLPAEVPEYLTRMRAVVRSVTGWPLLLMDTGPAAVAGASLDPAVARHKRRLCLNAGNSHLIAFHLEGDLVFGMLEHHTSQLEESGRLDAVIGRLLSGELTAAEVQEEGGHGAVVFESGPQPFAAVTGPRRRMAAASRLAPCFAAPFGSMMLAGCFGLARAAALKFPGWRGEIEEALRLD